MTMFISNPYNDLNAELSAAIISGGLRMMELLTEIPVQAFSRVGLIGGAQIETDGDFFTLSSGRLHSGTSENIAVILPVYDAPPAVGEHCDEDLADLLAWYPGMPDQWWQRNGMAWALGQHLSEFSFLHDGPIHFHRSPHAWLKAAGEGVCILDKACAYEQFGQAKKIYAEDRQHGRELEKLLTPAPLPRPEVVVPKGSAA